MTATEKKSLPPAPTADPDILEVQFSDNSFWPLCTSYSCVAFWSIIFIPCIPCIPCFVTKYIQTQKATLTTRYLKSKSGIFTKEDRSIPLDRIQDVKLVAGIVDQCCGASNLVVETAGGSGPDARPEAMLYSPVDPMHVRQTILDQRDRLLYGGAGASTSDFKEKRPSDSTAETVHELREIKASVQAIERALSK